MPRKPLESPWFRSLASWTLNIFVTFFILPSAFDDSFHSQKFRSMLYTFLYAHFNIAVTEHRPEDRPEDPILKIFGGEHGVDQQFRDLLTALSLSYFGLLFFATCISIFLLSTYHTSKCYDMRSPLELHFKLVHRHAADYSEDRETRYWKCIDSSLQARYLLELFWGCRIGLCFLVIGIFGPSGAMAYLLYHALTLFFATLQLNEPANSGILFLIHWAIGGIITVKHWDYLHITLLHLTVNVVLRFVVCRSRVFWVIWMNDLPCALCDGKGRDVDFTVLDEDVSVLGRFREEICRHCWEPWRSGEEVAILRCGHVYHRDCCDEWFRTGGRRRCPMCRFEVSRADYEWVSGGRREYTYEETLGLVKDFELLMWSDEVGIYGLGNWWEVW